MKYFHLRSFLYSLSFGLIFLLIPEQDIPEGGLTDLELNALERVYEKFKDFGSSDISDYSHKEKGYQSTKEGEIISYAYAKDIKLN